uniref:TATA-box binding protein n=1 Tax=viral metagenome TaxID=1070528 RepID=A0A6C0KS17_9ZZZZ
MATNAQRNEIRSFGSYPVSTKTFIVYTNLMIDIEKVFDDDILPITEYKILQKKRGRKKKQVEEDPNKNIPSGSIILVQYRDQYRGVKFKKSNSFFRNSMPIVMKVQDKLISFKVSRKGKFQITGCKTNEQAEICVLVFYNMIKPYKTTYNVTDGSHLKIHFEPVMYNIDFSVGFQIDRERLDIYINSKTQYTSLLETTIGYTGVNIKMPVSDAKLKKIMIECKEYRPNEVVISEVPFDTFCDKFKTKKKKTSYNTFLVFQSGSVIMSGKTLSCMEDAYYEFFELVSKCFPQNFNLSVI